MGVSVFMPHIVSKDLLKRIPEYGEKFALVAKDKRNILIAPEDLELLHFEIDNPMPPFLLDILYAKEALMVCWKNADTELTPIEEMLKRLSDSLNMPQPISDEEIDPPIFLPPVLKSTAVEINDEQYQTMILNESSAEALARARILSAEKVADAVESIVAIVETNAVDDVVELNAEEVADAEVTDAEVTGAVVTDAGVTDAEVTVAEVTDAEVTDAEVVQAEDTNAEVTPTEQEGGNTEGAPAEEDNAEPEKINIEQEEQPSDQANADEEKKEETEEKEDAEDKEENAADNNDEKTEVNDENIEKNDEVEQTEKIDNPEAVISVEKGVKEGETNENIDDTENKIDVMHQVQVLPVWTPANKRATAAFIYVYFRHVSFNPYCIIFYINRSFIFFILT